MSSEATTVFRETVADMAAALSEAAVDHTAFEILLPVCELAKCRATCCHDGAILSAEEADILSEMSAGVTRLPDGRFKTKVVEASKGELADDFPTHFSQTRCVFLDDEHRCRWQLQAVAEGKHPWFYKPISCWMHPLILKNEGARPVLTVVSREEDRAQFPTFTPCGKALEGAHPARESLKMELEMLAAISGRDFYGELNAPPGFTSLANESTSG